MHISSALLAFVLLKIILHLPKGCPLNIENRQNEHEKPQPNNPPFLRLRLCFGYNLGFVLGFG
jgi:hypothetical protein